MNLSRFGLFVFLIPTLLTVTGFAQSGNRGSNNRREPEFRVTVPAHDWDLILARPTADSVEVSVLAYTNLEARISYQPATSTDAPTLTPPTACPADQPVLISLRDLSPDTAYRYRLLTRSSPDTGWQSGPEQSFHTARHPGAPFTFTIQADSHLDGGVDPATYRQTLLNVRTDQPDFHLDLGDTFMVDKYPKFQDAAAQYLAQRYYFGHLESPLFLVLGNHDGETLGRNGRHDDEMAVWSNGLRKRYFPNPEPDHFYTGNSIPHPQAGLLQNYYAWTWGDALFIVLDPFWTSAKIRGRGVDASANWNRTLGDTQYQWLTSTLERSHATHKFVFIHHLVGGETPEGRGGAEASHFFEWGGHELDGTRSFAKRRPGWAKPVHDLLVDHHVTAVFHGHDHMYIKQERDGIIYQLVPQPGNARSRTRSAEEYGYLSGKIVPSPGHLRVQVTPGTVKVDYVRSEIDRSGKPARDNQQISATYTISSSPPE